MRTISTALRIRVGFWKCSNILAFVVGGEVFGIGFAVFISDFLMIRVSGLCKVETPLLDITSL